MSKAHILIIDDDKELVNKYKEILGKADYSIGYAYDGQEGLDKLKTIGADLVILDLHMPRMNGVKVLEAIRDDSNLRKTKVLVISSYAHSRIGTKAYTKGKEKGGYQGRIKLKGKSDIEEKKFPGKRRGMDIVRTRQVHLEGWLIDEVENALKSNLQSLEREKQDNEPDRILIVDDEKNITDKIASWLKEEGYKLLFACNGTEALYKLSTEPVDLVILDLKMPETTGEEVIRIMRSIPVIRDIPILVFSSLQDTTTYKDIFGISAGMEIIDHTNIRSRIQRYKYALGQTYDKPSESKLSSLLHLDKPRTLLARLKKELRERRRLGCGYLKQPITILQNKKGRWLEGYLEAYKPVGDTKRDLSKCDYCNEKKPVAYESRVTTFRQFLCQDCAKELKAKYPAFANAPIE